MNWIYSPHLRLLKKLFVLQWNFNIYLICKHSTIKESPPNQTSQLLYLPPPPIGEISKLFMGLKSWVELTPPRPWQLGRWCGRLDSTQLFRAQKSHLWCLPLTHSLPDYLFALLILPSAWFPRTIAGKSIETCQVLIPCQDYIAPNCNRTLSGWQTMPRKFTHLSFFYTVTLLFYADFFFRQACCLSAMFPHLNL